MVSVNTFRSGSPPGRPATVLQVWVDWKSLFLSGIRVEVLAHGYVENFHIVLYCCPRQSLLKLHPRSRIRFLSVSTTYHRSNQIPSDGEQLGFGVAAKDSGRGGVSPSDNTNSEGNPLSGIHPAMTCKLLPRSFRKSPEVLYECADGT